MESVAVLAVCVAIIWLVFWTVRNERARSIKDQKGLFRMRDREPPKESGEKPRTR